MNHVSWKLSESQTNLHLDMPVEAPSPKFIYNDAERCGTYSKKPVESRNGQELSQTTQGSPPANQRKLMTIPRPSLEYVLHTVSRKNPALRPALKQSGTFVCAPSFRATSDPKHRPSRNNHVSRNTDVDLLSLEVQGPGYEDIVVRRVGDRKVVLLMYSVDVVLFDDIVEWMGQTRDGIGKMNDAIRIFGKPPSVQ